MLWLAAAWCAVGHNGILTDTYRAKKQEKTEKEQDANFPKEVSMEKYDARVPSDHFPVMIEVIIP